ncbi:hypothetical protein MMC22_003223 [Lobaria immixta]|nr:hypothetical protein [Lobaria immixta]
MDNFRHHFLKPEIILHATLRLLQLVLALTVAGIYGNGVASANKPNGYDVTKWNYAVVIASFSAITSLVYVLPYVRRWVLWPWDFLLCVFWMAVLGIFARLYIGDHPSGGSSSTQVKSAAFVDLTNMILWFVTGLCGAAMFVRTRYGGGEDAEQNDNS